MERLSDDESEFGVDDPDLAPLLHDLETDAAVRTGLSRRPDGLATRFGEVFENVASSDEIGLLDEDECDDSATGEVHRHPVPSVNVAHEREPPDCDRDRKDDGEALSASGLSSFGESPKKSGSPVVATKFDGEQKMSGFRLSGDESEAESHPGDPGTSGIQEHPGTSTIQEGLISIQSTTTTRLDVTQLIEESNAPSTVREHLAGGRSAEEGVQNADSDHADVPTQCRRLDIMETESPFTQLIGIQPSAEDRSADQVLQQSDSDYVNIPTQGRRSDIMETESPVPSPSVQPSVKDPSTDQYVQQTDPDYANIPSQWSVAAENGSAVAGPSGSQPAAKTSTTADEDFELRGPLYMNISSPASGTGSECPESSDLEENQFSDLRGNQTGPTLEDMNSDTLRANIPEPAAGSAEPDKETVSMAGPDSSAFGGAKPKQLSHKKKKRTEMILVPPPSWGNFLVSEPPARGLPINSNDPANQVNPCENSESEQEGPHGDYSRVRFGVGDEYDVVSRPTSTPPTWMGDYRLKPRRLFFSDPLNSGRLRYDRERGMKDKPRHNHSKPVLKSAPRPQELIDMDREQSEPRRPLSMPRPPRMHIENTGEAGSVVDSSAEPGACALCPQHRNLAVNPLADQLRYVDCLSAPSSIDAFRASTPVNHPIVIREPASEPPTVVRTPLSPESCQSLPSSGQKQPPSTSHSEPPASQSQPSTRMPSIGQSLPPTRQCLLSAGQNQPSTSQEQPPSTSRSLLSTNQEQLPSTSQSLPSTSQGPSCASRNLRSTSENQPPQNPEDPDVEDETCCRTLMQRIWDSCCCGMGMKVNCFEGSSGSSSHPYYVLEEFGADKDNTTEKQEELRFFDDNGGHVDVVVEKNLRAIDLTQLLAVKNRVQKDYCWSIVEHWVETGLDRVLEDHEDVLSVHRQTEGGAKIFIFRRFRKKYAFYTNPEEYFPPDMIDCKNFEPGFEYPETHPEQLEKVLTTADQLPVIFSQVNFRQDKNTNIWVKAFLLLKGTKLLMSSKVQVVAKFLRNWRESLDTGYQPLHGPLDEDDDGLDKYFRRGEENDEDLEVLADLKEYEVYTSLNAKNQLKSPTEFGVVLRKTNEEDFTDSIALSFDKGKDRVCWVTAMRLAKYGKQLRENYKAFKNKQETIAATPPPVNENVRSRVAMDFTGKVGRIVDDPTEAKAIAISEGIAWKRKLKAKAEAASRFNTVEEEEAQGPHHTQPWYHKNMTRDQANVLLLYHAKFDGVFVVRGSTSQPGTNVLSFKSQDKVVHFPITLVEDPIERIRCYSIDGGITKFYDIVQLVEFYRLNAGTLPNRLSSFLERAPDAEDRTASSSRNQPDNQ